MYVCQNAEGVHTYLLKWGRGTCSSFRMLKGYMVRERLGTPVLVTCALLIKHDPICGHETNWLDSDL